MSMSIFVAYIPNQDNRRKNLGVEDVKYIYMVWISAWMVQIVIAVQILCKLHQKRAKITTVLHNWFRLISTLGGRYY